MDWELVWWMFVAMAIVFLPVALVVRLVGAIFSERIRRNVSQQWGLHVAWALVIWGAPILYLLGAAAPRVLWVAGVLLASAVLFVGAILSQRSRKNISEYPGLHVAWVLVALGGPILYLLSLTSPGGLWLAAVILAMAVLACIFYTR